MTDRVSKLDREPPENDPRKFLDPQILFDRSRSSAFDLLKTLISLATGSVAVYFITFTRAGTHLDDGRNLAALVSMFSMLLSVFTGLIAWSADSRFYNSWAHSLDKEKVPGKFWKQKQVANRVRFFSLCLMVVFFFGGILAASIYVWLNIRANQ